MEKDRENGQKENRPVVEPVIRVDRQLKFTGAILNIYEDTVIANGHEAHWDFIHHDGTPVPQRLGPGDPGDPGRKAGRPRRT